MKSFRPLVVLIALLGVLLFPSNQAMAGQHVREPAPNGVSPWLYSESWRLNGSWYGEGMHVDLYTDYYALDFGVGLCNKPMRIGSMSRSDRPMAARYC